MGIWGRATRIRELASLRPLAASRLPLVRAPYFAQVHKMESAKSSGPRGKVGGRGARAGVSVPHLPLVRYRFTFCARVPFTMPPFTGHVWRGVLGKSLHARDRALYGRLFEPPPPIDRTSEIKGIARGPSPFVIAAPVASAPCAIASGERLGFDLVLIGDATDFAPHIADALEEAGRVGLGPERGALALEEIAVVWNEKEEEDRAIWRPGASGAPGCKPADTQAQQAVPLRAAPWPQAATPVVPPLPTSHTTNVTIELLTPLRLKIKGSVVSPKRLRPAMFLMALLRRLSLLAEWHCAGAPAHTDFRALKALAKHVRMRDVHLAFFDLKRWSASQQREIPGGGLVGTFSLETRNLAPFWPYLWLGQWVHVGNSAAMGLGGYHVRIF